jgi:DNA-binding transcriptional ArsR family regulator
MDAIFKALNDPLRRSILDRLRQKDGQSLQELEEGVEMTRFGVMKHLKVLEEANLITTKKQGRFKYHYLNAVPLQEVADRWIEPLLQAPAARGMLNLKAHLEEKTMLDILPM